MEKINYKELASKLFCWGIFVIIIALFFKYLFWSIFPFLVAWGVAYAIFPIASELSSKTKISRKICSFFLMTLLLAIILSSLLLIGNRLLFEIQNLVRFLTENSDKIASYFKSIFDFINSIAERLPIINKLQDVGLTESITNNINTFITSIWQSLLADLGSAVPDLAADIVTALPNVLFVSLITVISCFYFALDVDMLHAKLKSFLPERIVNTAKKIKLRIGNGFKKYIKAYFVLFGITFAELLLGFWILGVEYSFVLALLIAFIDFLPVFGTGAVLVPWGIILLLMKNYYLGIGILILFVLMTIVRQVIEPKIVGKSLGVHPLVTLVTLYVGYQLFGLFGMIFLPIAVIVIFCKEDDANKKDEEEKNAPSV